MMERVRTTIRRKLIFATLTPLTVAILLCWLIGSLLITDRIFRQAQQKVVGDLNLARKVYQDEVNHLATVVRVAGLGHSPRGPGTPGDLAVPEQTLRHLLESEHLSFLNVIDNRGVIRYRAANPGSRGDDVGGDPLVARALKGEVVSGSRVYDRARLNR
jgi:two-component system NtrC family sensor kinase